MSKLADYQLKQQKLKELQDELQKLEQDDRLKAEMEFKDKLEALMQEFGKTSKDVLDLLNPAPARTKAAAQEAPRRKRKLKIYKNPNTGEVVETRGGNQKTLKAWKDEHGAETVESWLVKTED